jgi:hypothetical protein
MPFGGCSSAARASSLPLTRDTRSQCTCLSDSPFSHSHNAHTCSPSHSCTPTSTTAPSTAHFFSTATCHCPWARPQPPLLLIQRGGTLSCCKTSQKRPAAGATLTTTSSQGRCDKRAHTQTHTHARTQKIAGYLNSMAYDESPHFACFRVCGTHRRHPLRPQTITHPHTSRPPV